MDTHFYNALCSTVGAKFLSYRFHFLFTIFNHKLYFRWPLYIFASYFDQNGCDSNFILKLISYKCQKYAVLVYCILFWAKYYILFHSIPACSILYYSITFFFYSETYISTKLLQNLCLINAHFFYIDMPDVTASYGTPLDFMEFFGYFHTLLTIIYVFSVVSSPNFHRLMCLIHTHMSDKATSYGRISGLISFLEILMFEPSFLHQTFINFKSNPVVCHYMSWLCVEHKIKPM